MPAIGRAWTEPPPAVFDPLLRALAAAGGFSTRASAMIRAERSNCAARLAWALGRLAEASNSSASEIRLHKAFSSALFATTPSLSENWMRRGTDQKETWLAAGSLAIVLIPHASAWNFARLDLRVTKTRKFQPAPQTQGRLVPLQETKLCAEFRRIL